MHNEQFPKQPSSYPQSSELSPTIEGGSPKPQHRWVAYGANVLLGLGLLLVGLPFAWLLGIGMARLISAPSDRMPMQEVVLRRTNRVITEIYRLPSRWRPAPPPETRIEPIPIPTQPVVPLTKPPAALNARERQIAEEELAALRHEFDTIRKRLFDLESKLGQAQSTAEVESRLAHLERRLAKSSPQSDRSPSSVDLEPADLNKNASTRESTTALWADQPLLETTELKITLPSDALFAPGEARLLTTAPDLLNSIFEDFNQYPNATILIGSHTDDRMESSQSITLAFQQANALRAYLSGNLPDHRWVTIGYGQSQPITDNSTSQYRQRNRRIEIAIDRR